MRGVSAGGGGIGIPVWFQSDAGICYDGAWFDTGVWPGRETCLRTLKGKP